MAKDLCSLKQAQHYRHRANGLTLRDSMLTRFHISGTPDRPWPPIIDDGLLNWPVTAHVHVLTERYNKIHYYTTNIVQRSNNQNQPLRLLHCQSSTILKVLSWHSSNYPARLKIHDEFLAVLKLTFVKELASKKGPLLMIFFEFSFPSVFFNIKDEYTCTSSWLSIRIAS